MKKKGILIIIILVIVAIGALVAVSFAGKPVDKNSTETVIVKIEQGSGTSQIAQILSDNDLIKSSKIFRIVSKIKGYDGEYKSGTYGLSKSMSMKEIMKTICDGKTMANSFTVIEGETVEKIAKKLDTAGVVSYDDFINEVQHGDFSNYEFLKGNEKAMYKLEGYLYPETYSFDVNSDAHTIIDTMLKAFDESITSDIRKEAAKTKYSLREIVIIASIIEREAGIPSDRELVSSVIYNRLDKGIALQMDSIVSYVLQEDKVNLTYDDIAVESDYNPYKNKGLPPGPICSPGIDAIKAAISPADTNYIYFVASEKLDGSQNFTDDYNQFLKDKEAYYDAYEKAEKGKE